MLLLAYKMGELPFRALMQIYEEGNLENGAEFWPQEPPARQLELAEQEFYQYLRRDFFTVPGAAYALWQAEDSFVSALRLEPYKDGLLLEALETAPAFRRRGYARCLITAVQAHFGDRRIYSHVGKKNIPSLKVHERCGFREISDRAVYIDGSVNDRCRTLLWQRKP